jgi:DNA-binding FadR family transcriptional regulator
MSFKPVVRGTVYQQVADQIAEAILGGELAAGKPLPTERELAAQFDVSRTSIREALRALQARGLVVSSGSRTRPLRATMAAGASGPLREILVNLVRLQQVRLADLIDVRCALEAAALERAAERLEPGPLEAARTALDEMRRADVSVEEFHDADVRFHLALIEASGNQALHLLMLALRDAMAKHLHEALAALPDVGATYRRLDRQHAAILRAVEAGDGAGAGALARKHIMGFYERFVTEPESSTAGRASAAGSV